VLSVNARPYNGNMMMKFGKQHVPESTAAAALANLNGQIDAMRAQMRATTTEVVALEAKGIEAISPSEAGGYDVHEAALLRLNGHAYKNAAPQGTKPGIQLYLKRREIAELKVTIDLASQQWAEASIDVGRELLAKHGPEINALHRKRCLAILEIFQTNAALEEMRLRLLQSGSSVAHPLDGFSLRLFGELNPPSPANHWPRKYLSECLRAGIVNDRDLEK
jgi:hypothetical protein